MLDIAKKLVTFDAYKLRVGPSLVFASNDLQFINLYRAERVMEVTIWAPRLRELSLQGCFSLTRVKILSDHALRTPDITELSTVRVNTTNANLTEEIIEDMESNVRIEWERDVEPANPMESMLAAMNAGFYRRKTSACTILR